MLNNNNKKKSCCLSRWWLRLRRHPQAAATNNAQLTDNPCMIDWKLSNLKVWNHAEHTSSACLTSPHWFHFHFFALSITSLSLPHSLSFPVLSCHSLLWLKTFSISTHTFSIKLAYQISFGSVFKIRNSRSRSSRPACLVTVQPTYSAVHCCSPRGTALKNSIFLSLSFSARLVSTFPLVPQSMTDMNSAAVCHMFLLVMAMEDEVSRHSL